MFAKVFTQIFSSSIADDWRVRHVFEDILKLADEDGVVDMTPESIAAITRLPISMVNHGIAELEKPDPRSRNPKEDGRRIIRLDTHRTWGWIIVNYEHYRGVRSEDQRREMTRLRVRRFREKLRIAKENGVCNAETLPKALPALQGALPSASPSPSSSSCTGSKKGDARGRKGGFPTLADVKSWNITTGGTNEQAEYFWNHFEASGWVDRNGNRIVNPRAKYATWVSNDRQKAYERNERNRQRSPAAERNAKITGADKVRAREAEASKRDKYARPPGFESKP